MLNEKFFSAKAPGKLIISGEHAVVYGAPAIAIAINQYVVTQIGWSKQHQGINSYDKQDNNIYYSNQYNNKLFKINLNPKINFNLFDLKYVKSHTLQDLSLLKMQLQNKYDNFLNGDCTIKEVIKNPYELFPYIFTSLIERLHLKILANLEITVNSNLPIGVGLGSSAALIISCLRVLLHCFNINWDPIRIWKIAKEIENLQHGKSSGLDLYMSILGGCNYVHYAANNIGNHDVITEQINFAKFNFKLINTGKAASTTGECVAAVQQYFVDIALLNEFTMVTNAIKQALINSNYQQLIYAMRANHVLLSKIQVVPEKIQKFIKLIEIAGGAAKICGAGSVHGDNAGVLLLLGNLEAMQAIASDYQYELQDLNIDYSGVQII